jgi:hypothetical protein
MTTITLTPLPIKQTCFKIIEDYFKNNDKSNVLYYFSYLLYNLKINETNTCYFYYAIKWKCSQEIFDVIALYSPIKTVNAEIQKFQNEPGWQWCDVVYYFQCFNLIDLPFFQRLIQHNLIIPTPEFYSLLLSHIYNTEIIEYIISLDRERYFPIFKTKTLENITSFILHIRDDTNKRCVPLYHFSQTNSRIQSLEYFIKKYHINLSEHRILEKIINKPQYLEPRPAYKIIFNPVYYENMVRRIVRFILKQYRNRPDDLFLSSLRILIKREFKYLVDVVLKVLMKSKKITIPYVSLQIQKNKFHKVVRAIQPLTQEEREMKLYIKNFEYFSKFDAFEEDFSGYFHLFVKDKDDRPYFKKLIESPLFYYIIYCIHEKNKNDDDSVNVKIFSPSQIPSHYFSLLENNTIRENILLEFTKGILCNAPDINPFFIKHLLKFIKKTIPKERWIYFEKIYTINKIWLLYKLKMITTEHVLRELINAPILFFYGPLPLIYKLINQIRRGGGGLYFDNRKLSSFLRSTEPYHTDTLKFRLFLHLICAVGPNVVRWILLDLCFQYDYVEVSRMLLGMIDKHSHVHECASLISRKNNHQILLI